MTLGIKVIYPVEALEQILQFGNAMGAYVAQRKGGIPSMPTLCKIQEFIANQMEI